MHVHTNRPGKALEAAQKHGEFVTLKIENMRLQHSNLSSGVSEVQTSKPRKNFALVSACFGDGITQTFKDLGVDLVIEGGQTMNPSADDIAKACDRVNAKDVFVLPNNKNIILAAEQAKALSKRKRISW